MNSEIFESLETIPFFSIIRRLAKFIHNPSIQNIPLDNNNLRYALKDFIESLLLIGAITDLLYFLFDNKLRFGLGIIISPIRLGIFLGAVEIAQVIVFYLIIFCFLRLKSKEYHLNIARQALRSFAVINILMVPAWLIASDIRLYAIITNTTPIYTQYFLPIILITIAIVLLPPLLLIPTWKYLRKYHAKYTCLLCLILSIWAAKLVETSKHFSSTKFIVNKNAFCEQYIKVRYQKNIKTISNANYFDMLQKCLDAYQKLTE